MIRSSTRRWSSIERKSAQADVPGDVGASTAGASGGPARRSVAKKLLQLARAPRSADGRYASSSSGANGTGVSGGATSAGGASSSSKPSRATSDEDLAGDAARAAMPPAARASREVRSTRLEDRVARRAARGCAGRRPRRRRPVGRPQREVDARAVGDDGRVGARAERRALVRAACGGTGPGARRGARR